MKTILVVEDDPALRELLIRLFERHQFAALEAGDGLEALEIIRSQWIDAVVTDYLMPRMNGSELIEALKAFRPDFPSILLTGEAPDAVILRFIGSARVVTLIKPFESSALVSAVERVLSEDPIARCSIRVSLKAPCRIEVKSPGNAASFVEATILDISFSGAKIESPVGASCFALGQEIQLWLPGLDQRRIRARLRRVIHPEEGGPLLGVGFEREETEADRLLKRFILNKMKHLGIGIF